MDDEEVKKLVSERFGGKPVKPSRRERLGRWIAQVVHPLIHHRAAHVRIGPNKIPVFMGYICSICKRPMR